MTGLGRWAAGLVLVVTVAAACVRVDAPAVDAPAPDEGLAECGAAALQYLVGAPARDLDAMRFRGPVRVILPDMAVTMDFKAERVNFDVDAAGRITRVFCG